MHVKLNLSNPTDARRFLAGIQLLRGRVSIYITANGTWHVKKHLSDAEIVRLAQDIWTSVTNQEAYIGEATENQKPSTPGIHQDITLLDLPGDSE